MAAFKDFPFEILKEDENALLQPRFGNLTYEDTANSITYNLVPFVFLIIAFFLFRIFSLLGLSDFSSGGDSSYGAPSSGYGAPSSGYGAPSSSYGAPSSGYGAPSSGYGAPSSGYGAPSSGYNSPSSGSSINSNFNSVNTNSLTVANPVPNLGGAKVADLYYLYPELFQNQVGAQNDQNIGNIDYTDDPQGEDYVTRLLDINNYLGLQNYQQQQHQNGQPLQLHQRLGQPQHQIYDPYIITPEQLQMQLMQIEQAGK